MWRGEAGGTAEAACGYGPVGAVVGATYPQPSLPSCGPAMPHTWFLVPGFGSQGGTARTWPPPSMPAGPRRDRQQFPRHHLRPRHQALFGAFRRRRLARGRRGRHAQHDRTAPRRNAGRQALIVRCDPCSVGSVGCHCWLVQQCGNTGGQATRGTHTISNTLTCTAGWR